MPSLGFAARSLACVVRRPVAVSDVGTAGERASQKRRRGGASSARGEMAVEYSAAGLEGSADPRPMKRITVTDDDVDTKTVIFAVDSKVPVDPAQEILKKRLAVELDALRCLVKNVTSDAQPAENVPAPKPALPAVPPKKPEGNLPISVLLARAKEANEIRQQKGNAWEREKSRRALREMEKAVRPDNSIHPRDLEELGIAEYDYVLEEFGLFLRPDV